MHEGRKTSALTFSAQCGPRMFKGLCLDILHIVVVTDLWVPQLFVAQDQE